MHNKKLSLINIGILCIIACCASYVLERIWFNKSTVKLFLKGNINFGDFFIRFSKISGLTSGRELSVLLIFFIICLFIGIHFLIKPKKIYNFLFKHRYWVALIIFVFLVVNQYHGSSIAYFDSCIQPDYTSEYSQPVLGWTRAIRSDEWLVSTPNTLSAAYGEDAYGQYNYLMEAAQVPNIANNRLFFSYASLANPFNFGYFLLGSEYGASISWFGIMIMMFLISIEFLLILCKKNKLISVAGAILITFSGYNLWWSQVQWILGAEACIVCGYHFIDRIAIWKKILLAFGLGISIAYFVCQFYPAWQVPVGYLFLGLLIWVIFSNIKKIKMMQWYEWLIFILAFVFAASIILCVLYYNQEYTNIIGQTVYPGERFSTGGMDQITLQKAFAAILTPLSVFDKISNASEYSSMLTFFPVPLCISIVYLIRKKEWKKNLLLIILIIYTIFIGSYLLIGWPTWLCKYSLLSYSPSGRCVDVFSYAQLLLFLHLLSVWKKEDKFKPIFAVIIAGLYAAFEFVVTKRLYSAENIPSIYYVICAVTLGFLLFFLIANWKVKRYNGEYYRKTIYVMSAGILLLGLMVHPLQKGFDVIYEKPLAKEIAAITEQDSSGKWLNVTGDIVAQQYLLACGAPTINSTNIIPNMVLWKKLDPNDQYSNIYNRYAHVAVTLTENETSFELVQDDCIKLNLSYNDLDKTEASYLYYNGVQGDTVEALDQRYTLIYRDQCSIYKIN